MIKLGSKAKDKITGYSGIVTARTEWLHGCIRLGVQSAELKDGKPIDAQWFDEAQLEEVVEQEIKPSEQRTGGPQADPVRSSSQP